MATTPPKNKTLAVTIDAGGVYYRDLNQMLRQAVAQGAETIELHNVCGQRYIGTDLHRPVTIHIYGTPGNDLGVFMDGTKLIVHGNAQDCCGNTMNQGQIIVHGNAGDICGMSARGGSIFIRGNVGYRAGIHMKEYKDKRPTLVIGGTAQDFFGEYMAGGVLVLLGLNLKPGEDHTARFIGTGMHSGVIYMRGSVKDFQLGKEVGKAPLDDKDRAVLEKLIAEFAAHFGHDPKAILSGEFTKLFPRFLRPYGKLYAY